jgi:hypothetical protein
VRYTTEELHDIVAQYATDEEAVRALSVSSDREAVPGNS